MNRTLRSALLVLGVAAVGCTDTRANEVPDAPADPSLSKNAVALKQSMRELWADHVIWTRQYIVAAVANDPSATVASTRLLKNQEEIGGAVGSFYGAAVGDSLTSLLKQHIMIAVDVVAAAKAGNKEKLTDADKRWHDNSADIATYLAGANPNWTKDDLQSMLNEHLSVTTDEATARIKKNWDNDASTFDKIFDQAMMMADALTDGMVKQFPEKM